jgi:hypothetical protein
VPHTFDTDFFAALNPEDAGTPGGQTFRFIQPLDEAMTANSTDESAAADFIAALLRGLDFAPNEATIRTGKNFAFRIGREKRHAKADVCIVEGTNPLQQDKSHVDSLGGDVDARLIATAIAAYDEYSLYREEYGFYPRPGSGRLVGIVMRGSWPTFFRINLPNQIRNKVMEPEFDVVINQENLRVGTATVRSTRRSAASTASEGRHEAIGQ